MWVALNMALLLCLLIGDAVAKVDKNTWYHLMTVNPNDGQKTWQFDADLWYQGDKGNAHDGRDFINDTVRQYPIGKIKITSTNRAGAMATKVWELDTKYFGKSFAELISQLFDTIVSKSAELVDVPS